MDKQVYKHNGSIWLPNSFKYVNGSNKFIEWYYACDRAMFNKCLVNDITDCITIDNVLTLEIPFYYDMNNADLNQFSNINLDGTYTIKWSPTKIDIIYSSEHICPVNQTTVHRSNNAYIFGRWVNDVFEYVLKCHSSRCKWIERVLCNEESKENYIQREINNSSIVLNDLPQTHNVEYISNNFEWKQSYFNSHLYLCSQLGTGKTHLIHDIMWQHFENKNVLYISFRKTLSNAIYQRLGM